MAKCKALTGSALKGLIFACKLTSCFYYRLWPGNTLFASPSVCLSFLFALYSWKSWHTNFVFATQLDLHNICAAIECESQGSRSRTYERNVVVTCETKLFRNYFSPRRRPSEIIFYQRLETCVKLFQNCFTWILSNMFGVAEIISAFFQRLK